MADFPSLFGDLCANVIRNGGGCYTVRAYVDAQNGFGAMIRNHYVARLQQTNKVNWRLVELEM